jgi:hypothetical protein
VPPEPRAPGVDAQAAQLQAASQACVWLQRQASPQRHRTAQRQPVLEEVGVWNLEVLNIFVSVCWRFLCVQKDGLLSRRQPSGPLERIGYKISSEAAGIPNILLNVRLR